MNHKQIAAGNKGISIIMPCFNAGQYLPEAVHSVLSQNFGELDYELIIVNDGSTDQITLQELEAIDALNNPHIRIHHFSQNQGQSAARNQALKMARYDYVLPVDADDLLNTEHYLIKNGGYIQKGVKILASDPDVAFIYAPPVMFGARNFIPRPDPYDEKRQIGRGMVSVNGIYRRDEALAIGGYDPELKSAEDWTFWIDMLGERARNNQGRKVVRFTEPYYLYRQHEHGMNVNSRHRDSSALFQRFFERNKELYHENFPDIEDKDMVNFLVHDRTAVHVNSFGIGQSLCLKFRAALFHPHWLMYLAHETAKKHLSVFEHLSTHPIASDLTHHTPE